MESFSDGSTSFSISLSRKENIFAFFETLSFHRGPAPKTFFQELDEHIEYEDRLLFADCLRSYISDLDFISPALFETFKHTESITFHPISASISDSIISLYRNTSVYTASRIGKVDIDFLIDPLTLVLGNKISDSFQITDHEIQLLFGTFISMDTHRRSKINNHVKKSNRWKKNKPKKYRGKIEYCGEKGAEKNRLIVYTPQGGKAGWKRK